MEKFSKKVQKLSAKNVMEGGTPRSAFMVKRMFMFRTR